MHESDDPAAITRQLAELRLEHRDLDAAIDPSDRYTANRPTC